jgi:hypothetical protein
LQIGLAFGHIGLALRIKDHVLALRRNRTIAFAGLDPGEISLNDANRDIDEENYD